MPTTPSPVIAFILVLVLGSSLRADEPTPYEQKLSTAQASIQARAADKARSAFAEAKSLAPDEEARRWCELWLTVIPDKRDKYWSLSEDMLKKLTDHLETGLAAYAAGQPRDERWLSLKTRHATIMSAIEINKDLASRTYWDHDMFQTHWRYSMAEAKEQWASWIDRIEIADYLESLATTPDSIHRYIESLQQTVAMLGIVNQSAAGERMRAHLQKVALLNASPNNAAWCRLARARALSDDARLPLAARDQFWADALSAAPGTTWEKQILAAELLWRIRRHDGANPPARAPQDLHAALLELKALHQQLGPLDRELLPGDPYTMPPQIAKLETPQIILNGPTRVGPGQPAVFSFAAANHKSLKVILSRVYRNANEEALLKKDNGAEESRAWNVTLDDSRPGVWNRGNIPLPGLEPGNYVLRVQVGGALTAPLSYSETGRYFQEASFLVTDLAGFQARANSGATTLFLRRTSTNEPLTHTPVRLLIAPFDRPSAKHWLDLTTDAAGHLQIPVLANPSGDASPDLEQTIVQVAGEVLPFHRSGTPNAHREFKAIIDNTDTPPGKDVTVRILALNYQAGDLSPPSTPLYLSATLNNERLLRDRILEFESDCLATVRLPIPAGTKPENLSLRLSPHPGQTDNESSLVCSLLPSAQTVGYVSGRRLRADLRAATPAFLPNDQGCGVIFPDDQDLVGIHKATDPWITTARVISGAGKPVSFAGEARLVELQWDEQWTDPSGRVVGRAAIKNYREVWKNYWAKNNRELTPDWQLVHYDYSATPVATQPVRSDRKGNITIKFKIPHPGIYRMQLWSKAGQLPCIGGQPGSWSRDRLEESNDLTILALASDTTELALEPEYSRIFAPKTSQSGAPLTATVIVREDAESNTLCFLGLNETRFQPLPLTQRITRITFEHGPIMAGFGVLQLFESFRSYTRIAAPELRLPAGMQRVNRSLGMFTHHRMVLFGPPPSRDPEVFEIFPEEEISTETGFDLRDFLGRIGQRGANAQISDLNQEFNRESRQTSLEDNRIPPVRDGAKHGYCPESVPVWYVAPF